MKTKILLSILSLSTLAGYVLAQLPGFNYQAVLRSVDGEPMPNADVKIFFDLTDGPEGQVLYRESHSLTTNELGMINTVVGTGNVEMGTFEDIVSVENLNVKLQAEIPGEPNIVDVGFGAVGAIPYALYGEDADADPDNEMQSLSLEGDSLKISGSGGTSLENIRSRWTVLDEGTGYTFSLGDPLGARNLEGQHVIEEIKFNSISEAPVFVKSIVDFLSKLTFGVIPPSEATVTNRRSKINNVVTRDLYLVEGDLYLLRKLDATTVRVVYRVGPFRAREITIKLDDTGEKVHNIVEQDFEKTSFALSKILTENDQCERVNTTTLGLDGLKRECSFETTSADQCSLISATEKGETQYTCSYTSDGDVVQTFNNGATWTYGRGGCQYANSTDEVLCEYGEMGDGTGAAATYTNGAPTTICTDAAVGSGNGLVATFSTGQISTSCSANGEGGGDAITFGPNNSINTRCTSSAGSPNQGFISVNDEASVGKAFMFVNGAGQGVVQADVKNFVMDHPTVANMKIVYASLEGPEAGAYDRGTATLSNGEVFVEFPEHFQHVADPNSMTVMLTPLSADSGGLAVVEKTAAGFRIKELRNGRGSYSFDWEVKCKRKGFENFQVLQEAVKAPIVSRDMSKEIRIRQ